MANKITAISMRYKCEDGDVHNVLAIVNGEPSTPSACVKAMEKSDNNFVTSVLARYQVSEILELKTVSQNVSN